MSKNYQSADIGPLTGVREHTYTLPDSKISVSGKRFINDLVGLTGSEISFNAMPPDTTMPFGHKHRENEEVYIVLSGSGEFHVDGDIISVKEGSIIRMAPEAERIWRNTSQTEELLFITIQTKAGSLDNSKPTSDGVGVPKPATW